MPHLRLLQFDSNSQLPSKGRLLVAHHHNLWIGLWLWSSSNLIWSSRGISSISLLPFSVADGFIVLKYLLSDVHVAAVAWNALLFLSLHFWAPDFVCFPIFHLLTSWMNHCHILEASALSRYSRTGPDRMFIIGASRYCENKSLCTVVRGALGIRRLKAPQYIGNDIKYI